MSEASKKSTIIKKAAIWCYTVTAFALLVSGMLCFNALGIDDEIAERTYKPYTLNLGKNGSMPELRDWELESDHSLVSTSNDPMLVFYTKQSGLDIHKIKSVDIDIEYRTNTEETYAQIYYLHDYEMYQLPIQSGKNHLELKDIPDNAEGFRIDLTNIEDTRIKINSLKLNDNTYYSKKISEGASGPFIIFLTLYIIATILTSFKTLGRRKALLCAFTGIIFVGLTAGYTDAFGIARNAIKQNYPEYVFTKDDLGGRLELVDFKINPDRSITSTTLDPMVVIRFENKIDGKSLKLLTVNVEEKSDEPTYGDMFYLPNPTYYTYTRILTKQGLNPFYLINYNKETANGIRLDLTEAKDDRFLIKSIILNDNEYIYQDLKNRCLPSMLWCIVFAAAILIADHISKKSGKSPYLTNTRLVSYALAFVFGLIVAHSAVGSKDTVLGIIVLALTLALAHFKKIPVLLFELIYICINIFVLNSLLTDSSEYITSVIFYSDSFLLNIVEIMLLASLFTALLGNNLGSLLLGILFSLDALGNYIKITYHNDALTPSDISLLGEALGIAGDYISTPVKVVSLIIAIALIALIIKFRKKIWHIFKPRFKAVASVYAVLLIGFYILACVNAFSYAGITADKITELKSKDAIKSNGLALYTLLAFTRANDNSAPTGYGADLPKQVLDYVGSNTLPTSDVKPNVILILAESLFEVDKTPGVSFDRELFSNLKKYKATNVISPSYGGKTVGAEWEALTGLSSLFLNDGILAYNHLSGQKDKITGSVAREFADNGYDTYAVHANSKSYYGRDAVYEQMGIKTFYGINDFKLTGNDYLDGGRVKDEKFVDKLIEVLNEKKNPAFIMGVSIEGHYPYNTKYKNVDVKASAQGASEEELKELSCYAQTVYNFDKEIERLFEYCDNSDEPYLIYIYGDHLPTLAYNDGKDYMANMEYKYSTPLFAYSNYCDTSVDKERISLSQTATEIIKNSGIPHRPYFDFIASLKDKYPITHKEFIQNDNSEEMSLYARITWDLTRGERYLLKDDT